MKVVPYIVTALGLLGFAGLAGPADYIAIQAMVDNTQPEKMPLALSLVGMAATAAMFIFGIHHITTRSDC